MKRKILASIVVSIAVLLVYSSCTKIDTTDIGNDLIPAVDNVNTFDTTLDVITDNALFDDTTRMIYSSLHPVGTIENDIEFGKTSAILYSSFTPQAEHSYPFVDRDTVKIDSVVLSLSFGALYGDSNSIQDFEVREINPIYDFRDTLHYINGDDFPTRPELLGSATVNFSNLDDSVFYKNGKDTIRSDSELRIKLDTGWARRFVNYDTTAGDGYNDDSSFKKRFRGLEVRVSDGSSVKRALSYFNLTDNAKTRITFYCRIQRDGKPDTIAPVFTYKPADPQASLIRRTPANGYLDNVNNATDNDEKLFIQTTPGSYASVKIPGLSGFGNSVIHRAELIMERSPSAEEGYYTPPPNFFIEAMSAEGDSAFTIRNDFIPTNSGALYDQTVLGGKFNNNKYVFNLPRYVQSLVTKGFPNYTLRVFAPFTTQPFYMPPNTNVVSGKTGLIINPLLAGGRVVLYGGNYPDPTKKMRLHIIYSKI